MIFFSFTQLTEQSSSASSAGYPAQGIEAKVAPFESERRAQFRGNYDKKTERILLMLDIQECKRHPEHRC